MQSQLTFKLSDGKTIISTMKTVLKAGKKSKLVELLISSLLKNPEAEIYIDRDSNTFTEVINYLRDSK